MNNEDYSEKRKQLAREQMRNKRKVIMKIISRSSVKSDRRLQDCVRKHPNVSGISASFLRKLLNDG